MANDVVPPSANQTFRACPKCVTQWSFRSRTCPSYEVGSVDAQFNRISTSVGIWWTIVGQNAIICEALRFKILLGSTESVSENVTDRHRKWSEKHFVLRWCNGLNTSVCRGSAVYKALPLQRSPVYCQLYFTWFPPCLWIFFGAVHTKFSMLCTRPRVPSCSILVEWTASLGGTTTIVTQGECRYTHSLIRLVSLLMTAHWICFARLLVGGWNHRRFAIWIRDRHPKWRNQDICRNPQTANSRR